MMLTENRSSFGSSGDTMKASKSTISNPFATNAFTSNAFTQSAPSTNAFSSKASSANPFADPFKPSQTVIAPPPTQVHRNQLGSEIDLLLRKKSIFPPAWPTDSPGDPRQKVAMEAFWQSMKGYRAKVRSALIASGKIDDPDKPKRLEDAIDFKGTCEEMCPEFEKITRINEHDVQGPEKELAPDGKTLWPAPRRMVKALARSAAGQDAPLPDDIRSPKALRRTVDYLIGDVLASSDLATVHGFLWDRTRAVRRDFVFLQASMNAEELKDQVYCLETITRFHVVALHQMVKSGVAAEGFSEQQEVEQLGKALLSLIQAYEDCALQQVDCFNEAEFRAYYVLFNSHNPAILETVQDWDFRFWGGSEQVKIAVHLVETLQNVWDERGPLRPHAPTTTALNGYSRFFTTLRDPKVSYIMACFAEIHFNRLRKAFLKTILTVCRRPKDDAKYWTLQELNGYLHFDHEDDIITFGEAYGLHFGEDGDSTYLSFSQSSSSMEDPFPQLKQPHSTSVVEHKREAHSLPETIQRTIYPDKELPEPSLFTNGADSQSSPYRLSPSPAEALQLSPFLANPFSTKAQSPGNPFSSATELQEKTTEPDSLKSSIFSTPLEPRVTPQIPREPTVISSASASTGNTKSSSNTTSIFSSNKTLPSTPQLPTSFSSSPGTASVSPLASQTKPQFSFPVMSSQTLDPPTVKHQKPQPDSGSFMSTSDFVPSPLTAKVPVPPQKPVFSFPTAQPIFTPATDVATTSAPANSAMGQLKTDFAIASAEQATKVNSPPNEVASAAPVLPAAPLQNPFNGLTAWMVHGEEGIIEQWTKFKTEDILKQVYNAYREEELARIVKDEHDRMEKEIAEFRKRSLSVKYAYLWRLKAQRSWLRRQGRTDRENRRRFAEEQAQALASREAAKNQMSEDVVDDFRASVSRTSAKRRVSEQNSPGLVGLAPDTQPSTANPDVKAKRQRRTGPQTPQLPVSSASTPNQQEHKQSGHRRNQSENTLRQPKMADSMSVRDIMVQGFHNTSRIGLIPNYDPALHKAKTPSGVVSPYFRLKARGIVTLPDGSPLARSAALQHDSEQALRRTSSLDGIRKLARILPIKKASKQSVSQTNGTQQELTWRSSTSSVGRPYTPKRSLKHKVPRSLPSNSPPVHQVPKTAEEKQAEMESIKARAREIMAKEARHVEETKNKKRLSDITDDELFANARRVREAMDEESTWFREQSMQLSEAGI